MSITDKAPLKGMFPNSEEDSVLPFDGWGAESVVGVAPVPRVGDKAVPVAGESGTVPLRQEGVHHHAGDAQLTRHLQPLARALYRLNNEVGMHEMKLKRNTSCVSPYETS